MNEILPGIFHWSTFHEGIRHAVSSYYVSESASLIDPMLPEEGLGWLRDHGPPERILLTNRHHYRHSGKLAEAFGCPVLCPKVGLHEFADGQPVEGYDFGAEVVPGIVALEVGAICPDDGALHIAAGEGALAFADGIIRYGSLGFVPDSYMGDDPEAVKQGTRDSAATLLDLRFDSLLFAHGDPLVGGGKEALRAFTEGEAL